MARQTMPESFYCFYPSTPLWVGKMPDFSRLKKGGISLEDLMSEQVIRSDCDGHCVVFCKDGMCMVRIDSLDREMWDIRAKESAPRVGKHQKRLLSERWLSLHRRYVHYLNVVQLLLDSALLQVDQFAFSDTASLRFSDVFPVIIDETKLWPVIDYSYGVRGFHATRDALRRGRRPENYDQTVSIEEDEQTTHRRERPEAIFRQAIARFHKAQADADLIDILNQTLVAVDNYNVANYSVALVQGWFLIELFINMCWVEFLSEQQAPSSGERPPLNKDRTQFLTGGDVTAAIMSNVLERLGRIDTKVFRQIDSVRKARNRVSHSLDKMDRIIGEKLRGQTMKKAPKDISSDDCKAAFQVVEYFLDREYNIKLGIGAAVL